MIYVVLDIHGNKGNFDSISEKIDFVLYGIQLLQQIVAMPNTHRLSGGRKQQVSISASAKTIPRRDTCIVYAGCILIYSFNSARQMGWCVYRRKGGAHGEIEIS